jgi:hypothetical protein
VAPFELARQVADQRSADLDRAVRAIRLQIRGSNSDVENDATMTLSRPRDTVAGGWVFASEVGGPTVLREDHREWADCSPDRACLPPGAALDARHTAATLLLMTGVDSRTVMASMGWSSLALVQRFQHVVDDRHREAAVRMRQTCGGPEVKLSDAVQTVGVVATHWLPRGTQPECRSTLQPSNFGAFVGGQGQDRTADLPLFRRSLVPTELPGRTGERGCDRPEPGESIGGVHVVGRALQP